ncbi:MAG: tetratricopeptide repeat protein [Planctomycetes bacterium]|nr:tetratricopeptide repeat protein [Planctomycetota bacterium]
MLLALLIAGVLFQDPAPGLKVGETTTGSIAADAPVVVTERIARAAASAFPTRGRTFAFAPESSGPRRVELRSYEFKPYLVVRDEKGAVLAEDEYSLFGILPRVVVELEAGHAYSIDAASRCGQPGEFELVVNVGAPEESTNEQRAADALTFAREGVARLEARNVPADTALGTALHRLAYATLVGGQVPEAIALFRRALEVRESVLGNHPLTSETCRSLGGVLAQTGDAAGAAPLFERAVRIDELVFGPNHPVTASSLVGLAGAKEAQGELAAAEPLLRRALAIDETTLGPDEPTTMALRARLALFLHRQSKFADALPLYARELELREAKSGANDPESARVLEAMAAIHEQLGDTKTARSELERALARREATSGANSPATAETMAHLGVLLQALGEHDAGSELVRRATAIDTSVFIPEMTLQEGKASWWNERTARWWRLLWAAAVAGLFAWSLRRERATSTKSTTPLRGLFAASLVVSALTYTNFLTFNYGTFVHRWDEYHYFVGAKYFDELGYDGLYDCTVIADSETPGWSERVKTRWLRDLRTNEMVPAEQVLANGAALKARFTPERWRAFSNDVAWFRERESADRWEHTTADHGFNATPVWTLAGSWIAQRFEASDGSVLALALLDQFYLVALILVAVWGFGLRIAAVAIAVLATSLPAEIQWTGGSFLRWDWLFFTVASFCCLRRDRPLLGGVALGYATLLRVFPGFVFVGPVFAWGAHLMSVRREGRGVLPLDAHSKTFARFFAGAALSAVVLLPLSLVARGGVATWSHFAANSSKHMTTPLTNHMGLRTVVSWRPDDRPIAERDHDTEEWMASFRAARARGWSESKLLYWIVVLGWLALLAYAVRGRELWVAAALGATLIAAAAELTSYYYAFVVVIAFLCERRPRIAFVLLGLGVLSLFVALAPLPGMSPWLENQFASISCLTLAAFAWILVGFARERRELAV